MTTPRRKNSCGSSSDDSTNRRRNTAFYKVVTQQQQQQQQCRNGYLNDRMEEEEEEEEEEEVVSQLNNTTTSSEGLSTSLTEEEEVSADSERQILLLMLLAQVCSLHDPTPRTFTVHVLSLYERGILDVDSIRFLFDLGLVPPNHPTHTPTTTTPLLRLTHHPNDHPPSTTKKKTNDHGNSVEVEESYGVVQDVTWEEVLSKDPQPSSSSILKDKGGALVPYYNNNKTTTTTSIVIPKRSLSKQELRIQQTAVIRTTLEQFESSSSNNNNNNNNNNNTSHYAAKEEDDNKWTVENHPLSLSRYQREFVQKSLLNSGAFGDVYRATHKMDGTDYAIKRVAFSATGYSNESVQLVVREVQCLAQCDHVHCVRYYTSWLEPSWMTGSGNVIISSPDDIHTASPEFQQKLLTDVQRLVLHDQHQDDTHSHSHSSTVMYPSTQPSTTPLNYWNNSIHNNNNIHNIHNNYGLDNWSYPEKNHDSDHDWSNHEDSDYSEWTKEEEDDDDRSYYNHHTKADASHWSSKSTQQPQPQPLPKYSKKQSYQYQICLFIQMQMCHPSTLADWIKHRNSTTTTTSSSDRAKTALEIFTQIVKGLEHVHSKGIIHRDLKPANIFAADDGIFKIGDFGLSKLLRTANGGMDFPSQNTPPPTTKTNTTTTTTTNKVTDMDIVKYVPPLSSLQKDDDNDNDWKDPHHTMGVGTASYAAPEQIQSDTYGPETDIFSLGLILLELFSNFTSEHERASTFYDCRHLQQLPTHLTNQYPQIASLILQCCQHNAQDRPTAHTILQMKHIVYPSSIHPTESIDTTKNDNDDTTNNNNNIRDYPNEIQRLRAELEEKEQEIQKQRRLQEEKDNLMRIQVEQMTQQINELKQSNEILVQQLEKMKIKHCNDPTIHDKQHSYEKEVVKPSLYGCTNGHIVNAPCPFPNDNLHIHDSSSENDY